MYTIFELFLLCLFYLQKKKKKKSQINRGSKRVHIDALIKKKKKKYRLKSKTILGICEK